MYALFYVYLCKLCFKCTKNICLNCEFLEEHPMCLLPLDIKDGTTHHRQSTCWHPNSKKEAPPPSSAPAALPFTGIQLALLPQSYKVCVIITDEDPEGQRAYEACQDQTVGSEPQEPETRAPPLLHTVSELSGLPGKAGSIYTAPSPPRPPAATTLRTAQRTWQVTSTDSEAKSLSKSPTD